MTGSVVLRRAARQDVDAAASWYRQQRRGLELRFLGEVDRAIRRAARTPQQFPRISRDIRRVRLRGFPYFVYYIIETERLVILAVFHARRSPMTWQSRD